MPKELINLAITLVVAVLLIAIALCGVFAIEAVLIGLGLTLEHLITALLTLLAVISIKEKF